MNSREKGKRGERRWRDVLRDAGYLKAHRGVQYSGTADSPDVQCPELPGLHFEVKAVEKLNVWAAMAQAEHDAGPSKTPVVAHTRNRSGWLVTMRAADWLRFLAEVGPDLRAGRIPDLIGPALVAAPRPAVAPPPLSQISNPAQPASTPHAA